MFSYCKLQYIFITKFDIFVLILISFLIFNIFKTGLTIHTSLSFLKTILFFIR